MVRMSDVFKAFVFGGGGLIEVMFICTCLTALTLVAVPYYDAGRHYVANQISPEPSYFFVIASIAVHETMYYGYNGVFMLIGRTGLLDAYRVERKVSIPPTWQLIRKTLLTSFVSHWLLQPFAMTYLYSAMQMFGSDVGAPLPVYGAYATQKGRVWSEIFLPLAFAVVVNDVGFYSTHRLLHHPALYKRFHKQHHEYKNTINIAAEYATPVEAVLSNYIPMLVPVVLVGMHPLVWLVFLFWRLRRTYETHSGFSFEGTLVDRVGLTHGKSTRYHDFHHSVNVGNFGGPADSLWDVLGGTQDAWNAHELAREKKKRG